MDNIKDESGQVGIFSIQQNNRSKTYALHKVATSKRQPGFTFEWDPLNCNFIIGNFTEGYFKIPNRGFKIFNMLGEEQLDESDDAVRGLVQFRPRPKYDFTKEEEKDYKKQYRTVIVKEFEKSETQSK